MARLRGIVLLALLLSFLAVRPPASAAVQSGNPYPERLRTLIAAERARVLAGEPGDPEFVDKAVAILRDWYTARIAPGLQAAARDCAVAGAEDGILPEAQAWAQGIELLTGGGDEAGALGPLRALIPDIYDKLADALARCYENAKERCVRDGDLTQPPRMLSLAKQLQLIGSDRVPGDIFNDIERCLTFELEFESRIVQLTGEGRSGSTWYLRAVVPLQREGTDPVTGL
jgi:hypothetical protein